MKRIHHIGERWTAIQVERLADFGITVNEDVFSYIQVEPDQFELIEDIVMQKLPIHVFGAVFDKVDMNKAEWLALTGLRPFGFPQPKDTFDFLDVVYDTSHSCKACGIILGKQKNPFRITSDKTKWQAFQLEWIYDEIFVKREVYNQLFVPLGIGFWPVLIHRSGEVSEHLVQLDLPRCKWEFDMTDMPFKVCIECGRRKYQVRPLDFLPSLNGEIPNEIFRGTESYGSGGQAYQRIYLTQRLRQEFLNRKIAKWFQFYPLKSQPT